MNFQDFEIGELAHPFQRLPSRGPFCNILTAKFYNPKHTGDRQRLDRLEKETRIVMRMLTSLKWILQAQAVNACFRHPDVGEKLAKHLRQFIQEYKLDPARNKDSDDSDDSEEDQELNTATEIRIAKLFVRKRYVLNIIFFILANEDEIARNFDEDLKSLEELALEDANDWMELLDCVETMKNPNYLG